MRIKLLLISGTAICLFLLLFKIYQKGKTDCEAKNTIEQQKEKIIYQDKIIYVQKAQKRISQAFVDDPIIRDNLMQWLGEKR